MKKFIILVSVFFMLCSPAFALDIGDVVVTGDLIEIGFDQYDSVYALITNTVKQNKHYISCSYLILPNNEDSINELIDMVDNPTATGMVITRAFSKDFKYSQTLRMIVIDSKAKALGYQIYEFDIKNYEKINMESIQGYLVNILKKILNSKNV